MPQSEAVFITDAPRPREMIQIVGAAQLQARGIFVITQRGPSVEPCARDTSVISSVCKRRGQMHLSDALVCLFFAVCCAGQPDRVSDLSRRHRRAQICAS